MPSRTCRFPWRSHSETERYQGCWATSSSLRLPRLPRLPGSGRRQPPDERLDPAGKPHPQLPLRLRNDLRGVDRIEERETGDGGDHEDPGHQQADLATTGRGLGSADAEPEDVGHRERHERHERDLVEAEDGAVLVVE